MALPRITSADADLFLEQGQAVVKKPSVIFVIEAGADIEVETDSGTLIAQEGSLIAHDPVSGHVWPLSTEYFEQHYEYVEILAIDEDEDDWDTYPDEDDIADAEVVDL